MPLTDTEAFLQRLRVRIVLSRRQTLGDSWRFDLLSPFWRLYVNNRRGAFLQVGGRRQELDPGNIYVVPAWVGFQTGLTQPVVHDYVHFYLEGLPQNWLRRLFQEPREISRDAVLRRLVQDWQRGFGQPDQTIAHFFHAATLVHAVLADWWAELAQTDLAAMHQSFNEASPVQPAIAKLEKSFAPAPTNEELAALCGMSEDHFIRSFRKAVGVTPAQYGLGRRLDVAAALLAETSRSIEDIAELTGFTDRFHLSRVFKAKLGTPPAEYRRQHSGTLE